MKQDPPRWLERIVPITLILLAIISVVMVVVALYVIIASAM